LTPRSQIVQLVDAQASRALSGLRKIALRLSRLCFQQKISSMFAQETITRISTIRE
jgi:hypothetical protein